MRSSSSFEIKSATLPLVALLLKSSDLALVAQELKLRFGEMPEFFDHDPLVVDLTAVHGQPLDIGALLPLLKSYRLAPVAVKGGCEQQKQAALAAGLASADEATPVRESAPPPPAAPPAPAAALVVDKPLRSGQQVYARGRDLVVLAMVNPGAEVIADGHIHVYAPLRGKAIAGARGDAQARILTLCLEPELVSIAGTYRTSETELPAQLRGRPAQIRLADGKLVMEPLNA